MVLFTHNIKKIKGTAPKNGNIDSTCKWAISSAKKMGRIPILIDDH